MCISNINLYHASLCQNHICLIPGFNVALKDGLCPFLNWFQTSHLWTLYSNIQALLRCKIKVELHMKLQKQHKRDFCKLKHNFSIVFMVIFNNKRHFPNFSSSFTASQYTISKKQDKKGWVSCSMCGSWHIHSTQFDTNAS